MPLTSPTPIVMWTSTDPAANVFDLSTKTWNLWGVAQYAEQQPLLNNERDVRWVESAQYPSELYMGKQYPLWSCSYNVMNGLPIYQSMPKESRSTDVHTLTLGTPTENVLPTSTIHYVNNSGSVDNAWALFNAKQTSVLFGASLGFPLTAFSTYYGCVPWVYNNDYAADGVIDVQNYNINAYTNPSIPINASNNGFALNKLTEITYDGNAWDNDVMAVNMSIDRGCNYIHQGASDWQEEVWPSEITEGVRTTGMVMDLFFAQGRDKTVIEDIFNTAGVRLLKVKLFEDRGSTNYISFGTVGATGVYHNKASIDMPKSREGVKATTVVRFLIPQPENIIKDGYSNDYSGV